MSSAHLHHQVPCSRDELLPPEGKAWECTGHLTRDGEVRDWVRVPELRCGPHSWLKPPSNLSEDTGPSASVDHLKAQAAPTRPRAPPEHHGRSPWPRQPASGRDPKVEHLALPASRQDDAGQAEHARRLQQRTELDDKDRRARELRPQGCVKCEKKRLRKGDHIFVPTEQGRVYHHAIVLDEPDERSHSFRLIHYLTTGVCVTSSAEDSRFLARAWVWLLPRANYYNGRFGRVHRSADEIVTTAVRVYQASQAADRRQQKCAEHAFAAKDYRGYGLDGGNNCEHFCTYVVTGRRFCHQATETTKDIGASGGGVLLGMGALGGGMLFATGPIGWTAATVVGLAATAVTGWHVHRLPSRALDASRASRTEDDQHAASGGGGGGGAGGGDADAVGDGGDGGEAGGGGGGGGGSNGEDAGGDGGADVLSVDDGPPSPYVRTAPFQSREAAIVEAEAAWVESGGAGAATPHQRPHLGAMSESEQPPLAAASG